MIGIGIIVLLASAAVFGLYLALTIRGVVRTKREEASMADARGEVARLRATEPAQDDPARAAWDDSIRTARGAVGTARTRVMRTGDGLRRDLLLFGLSWVGFLLIQFCTYTWLLKIDDMVHWAWILFYAQFAYVAGSFRIVGEEEVGAIILFGDPRIEVPSGLSFVPVGIFSLRKDQITFHQMELPAEPELIYHGKGDEVPEGKYPPIRVTAATRKSSGDRNVNDESDPLDNDRVTYEVSPIVRWKIQRGEYITFLRTIGSPEEVRKQFSDTATAIVVEELSGCTVAYALKSLATVSARLKEELEELTRDSGSQDEADAIAHNNWGIVLDSARIKMPSFHRDLNAAIAAPATEKLKGEGEKRRLTLKGEGVAAAEKALLDVRTDAFKKQATELGVHPALVLSADTARGIAASPNEKIIIPGSGGFSDLIGGAMAIAESVRGRTANQQPDQNQRQNPQEQEE